MNSVLGINRVATASPTGVADPVPSRIYTYAINLFILLASAIFIGSYAFPEGWSSIKSHPLFGLVAAVALTTLGFAYQDLFRESWKQHNFVTSYYTTKGDRAFENGEYQSALCLYGEALKWSEKNGHAYSRRGEVKRILGHTTEAIKDFAEAIKWAQGDSFAWTRRAIIHAQNGDVQLAIDDLNMARQLSTIDPFPHIIHGALHLDDDRACPQSLHSFEKALELDEHNLFAKAGRAVSLYFLEHNSTLLENLPLHDIDRKVLRGIFAFWKMDKIESARLLREVPQLSKLKSAVAYAKARWNIPGVEITAWDNYLKHFQSKTPFLSLFSDTYLGNEVFLRNCIHALLIRSNVIRATGRLGVLKNESTLLQDALKLFPTAVEFLYEEGKMHFESRDYSKALLACEKALKHSQGNTELVLLTARCYMKKRRFFEAIDLLRLIGEHDLLKKAENLARIGSLKSAQEVTL